jgi:peptide/nickel transport system substrate-binding protein
VIFARRWFTTAAVATLGALVGCGDLGGGDKTVVISVGADGDVPLPGFTSQTQARVYSELIFDHLAELGMAQNTVGDAGYEPRIARSWSWAPDSLSITFQLDPRYNWHDGKPVTARDVRFTRDLLADPKAASTANSDMTANVDSVTTPDSMSVKVWYKRRAAEQFHSIAYNLIPLPEHLLAGVPRDSIRQSAFGRSPVGNGPFKFVAWEKNKQFELASNPSHPLGAPRLSRVIFSVSLNPQTAVRVVLAGDADFIERMTGDDMAEAARTSSVRVVAMPRYEYGFMGFNLRTPDGKRPHALFGDLALRRALTMAVDRAMLVRSVHDSLARMAFGPFSRLQWSADTTLRQIAYDTAGAARLLDSLGWKRGTDGVRARGGRKLEFSIVTSSSSRPRVRYAELLQQSFTAAGAKVRIDLLDQQGMGARVGGHSHDAVVLGFGLSPSPSSIRQTWGISGYLPGRPTNAGGWDNAAFAAHVDSGLAEPNLAAARVHMSAAYQILLDDAPAIWLFDDNGPALASTRLVLPPFRPDAWWASLRSWDVTGPPRRSPGGQAKQP